MRSRVVRNGLATFLSCCLAATAVADEKSSHSQQLNNPPEGFIALFNGEDLSGWIGMRMNPRKFRAMSPAERSDYLAKTWEKVEQHWSVDDGVLVNDGKGPFLTTAEDYGDFELRLQYKTVPGADSGIYLRGVPQVQIWDSTVESGLESKGSAGLYNNKKHPNAPLVDADKPFGEWNSLRITMVGESVTVVFNGELVVNEVPLENYWDRSIPVFPVGPIQLQTHGGEIRFRNIFLRKIPRKPPESGYLDEQGRPFGEGWTPLSEMNATPAGDVEYHLLFSLNGGEPAEFVFESADQERGLTLTISPEAGATLTARLPNGKAFPLAHAPAANSGLKESGRQHLYARIRGNSIQVWLNETPIVDVLYPHLPKNPTARVSGATVHSGYVRSAKNDEHVEMFPGNEEGYVSLYNGKNLEGWIGGKEGYRTEPNVLVATKESGNILTKETFGDFRFRFEFKLRPGANNGLALRAPRDGHASYDGIESQILDNTADRYNDLHDYQFHGSLYGVVPALRGYLKPVGHWNQEEIIVDGNHFKVILNGKVIIDADIKEAASNGTPDGRDHPGLSRAKGHIGFLGHGHVIEFRNLRIKRLD